MGFIRITQIGALMLGAATIAFTAPAYAGFEFSGGSAAAVEQQAPAQDYVDAPMPIVPVEEVAAAPLDAPMGMEAQAAPVPRGPDVDHVLKIPVSHLDAAQAEPVYIKRQRNVVMKAPKNQPVNTEALLAATENADMIELEGEPRANLVAAMEPAAGEANNDSGALVIDPYPLGSPSGATHGGDMGTLATEQALMEEGGSLRTIAVPGRDQPGMIERAKTSSRYDASSQYLDRTPVIQDAAVFGIPSSMTPIPGGDSTMTGQTILSAASAQMPRPATPENYAQPESVMRTSVATSGGNFTEAVGFGRELPLALALSQVVPPQYSYAFGEDVNVGSTVSWQGGKPWNEVLEEMLATQGMRAVISGNQVTILNKGRAA
jgi:hypothetical protein